MGKYVAYGMSFSLRAEPGMIGGAVGMEGTGLADVAL